MQNIKLPPECSFRQAQQKDIWKLLFLPLEPSGRNRNFQVWVTIIQKIFSIILNLSLLLLLISFFSYLLSRKLGEYLVGYIMSSSLVPDIWQVKLAFLLYGNPTGFGATISENPNLWGTMLSFICSFILFSPLIIIILRQVTLNTWVVECNRRIVAAAKLLVYPQQIILNTLYVTPTYRSQGIGSALVTHIKQLFEQPIYLVCLPELVSFYVGLGFLRISSDRLFFLSRINGELVAMVRDNTVSTVGITETTTNTLSNFSVNDYVVRPAQDRDIKLIRSLLFTSPTFDFYLPFGINFTIFASLYFLILTFSCLIYLLLIITGLADNQIFKSIFSNTFLSLTLIGVFIIPIAFIVNILGLQNHSQFFLLEYNQKLIGYARISYKSRYFILNYSYINPSLKPDCEIYFIQQILNSTTKPILVACNYSNVRIYKDLGFIPISIQNLPKKLRLGARINLQWGGMNLVHPNNQASQ
ncbi:GCN5-related N-acetyltransferase [Nostoc sp. NIES-2111]|nr:GCN5-related N-acetyltransferase [Nostoc sp. NIES-2111]